MVRVKCPNCGAGVDLTKDGLYGHCASCNNIIEFTEEELKAQKGQEQEQKKTEKDDEGGKKVEGEGRAGK